MKRLKCPECGVFLESVDRYCDCVENQNVSITEDGIEIITNVYNSTYGDIIYTHNDCQHEGPLKDFIVDTEQCQHNNVKCGKYHDHSGECGSSFKFCADCGCIIEPKSTGLLQKPQMPCKKLLKVF